MEYNIKNYENSLTSSRIDQALISKDSFNSESMRWIRKELLDEPPELTNIHQAFCTAPTAYEQDTIVAAFSVMPDLAENYSELSKENFHDIRKSIIEHPEDSIQSNDKISETVDKYNEVLNNIKQFNEDIESEYNIGSDLSHSDELEL